MLGAPESGMLLFHDGVSVPQLTFPSPTNTALQLLKETNVFSTYRVPRSKLLKTQELEQGRMGMQIEMDLNTSAFGLDKLPDTKERASQRADSTVLSRTTSTMHSLSCLF